jgi:murein DD-endopeptidase MepM/ murein hydrolase activator NlpD
MLMVNVLASLLWTFAPIAPSGTASTFDLLNNVDLAVATAPSRECTSAPLELTLDLRMELPAPQIAFGSHLESDGEWTTYEQIAKRPDRPSDYESYRYPVPRFIPSWPRVVYGYDLDAPSEQQRQGMRAIGHGGVDLAQFMGTPVKLVPLAQQVGDAEVVYIGPLFGNSVVTRHTVREGGSKHDYIVIYGHLSETPKTLMLGARLTDGEVVGSVGDSGSPNLVHLHLEIRRLREGVSAHRLYRDAFVAQSVVTDPRNVLPVASPEPRSGPCTRAVPIVQLSTMRLTWEDIRQPDLSLR